MKIFLILPTQLFQNIKLLKKYDLIYLLEESYYINSNFHKQKLLLHISSMNYYYDYLLENKIKVKYFNFNNIKYNNLLTKNNEYFMYDPIDKVMVKLFNKYNINYFDSPLFLNNYNDLLNYKNIKDKKKNYNQSDFYKFQRIKYNILIDKNNKPLYDKWSFDTHNREKFTKDLKESKIITYNNKYLNFSNKYINDNFSNSFGIIDNFYYPCTHNDAIKHFKYFIKNKIKYFGKYQDAISDNIIYGFHSNISALLNIGLLIPFDIINIIIKYFNKSNNKKEIINSIEGLIRQIIGWREYMHFIYTFYSDDIKHIDYIKLDNNLPNSWYTGKTELELLNNLIIKVQKYAYLHHIERLMVINNLMYLYNIKFTEIYKWFMICFIDSYDWVMIPNILMNINSLDSNIKYMTRVYLASDNYIKKMSDYKNKDDFQLINKLYWNFIKKNKKILKKDYGLASQVSRI